MTDHIYPSYWIQPEGSQPFVEGARAQTMQRDFDKLRKAIRNHDSFAAEAALEKCERWFSLISPNGAQKEEAPDGT